MKTVKVLVCCVLAAVANCMLSELVGNILRLPLFLDTLFTCAVTFAVGALSGIFTAILSTAIVSIIRYHLLIQWDFLFVLCSISEVLLIGAFRHLFFRHAGSAVRSSGFYDEPYSFVSLGSVLLLLYITMCMAVSLLGGIIDFIVTVPLHNPDSGVYPHTFFKLGLLRNRLPRLATDILSRIPVNIVDRFIVTFGGYGLGMLLRRVLGSHAPLD
jgi:hypothetical protein